MNTTAVVILNFNGRELLRQFLPSVIQFTPAANIIVADNHSTDGSTDVVRQEFPAVQVIDIPENLGFCGGYNYALKKVQADYFVLLNSDVEVTPGWLDPILAVMDTRPAIVAAQPKVLSYKNKKQFEYAGGGGGFIDTLGYPFCRGRIFNALEDDAGQYNDTRPVFWATGACLVIRASAFRDMDGFDEDFFAHMEEIDLCWKLHRQGLQVYYVGSSTVYHVGGATLSKSNPRKTYFNFRNSLWLMVKHMPLGQLIWKLPMRVVLDWCAGLLFLFSGHPADLIAVLKAHFHFLWKIRSTLRKRRAIKSPKKVDRTLVYSRPIVVDFYALGKKSFGNLRF